MRLTWDFFCKFHLTVTCFSRSSSSSQRRCELMEKSFPHQNADALAKPVPRPRQLQEVTGDTGNRIRRSSIHSVTFSIFVESADTPCVQTRGTQRPQNESSPRTSGSSAGRAKTMRRFPPSAMRPGVKPRHPMLRAARGSPPCRWVFAHRCASRVH